MLIAFLIIVILLAIGVAVVLYFGEKSQTRSKFESQANREYWSVGPVKPNPQNYQPVMEDKVVWTTVHTEPTYTSTYYETSDDNETGDVLLGIAAGTLISELLDSDNDRSDSSYDDSSDSDSSGDSSSDDGFGGGDSGGGGNSDAW